MTLHGEIAVDIQGDSHVARLNMNAFRLMCNDCSIQLAEIDKFMAEQPLTAIPKMIFWAVMNEADWLGVKRPKLEFDHFAAHIVSDPETFERYTNAVVSAMGGTEEVDDEGN